VSHGMAGAAARPTDNAGGQAGAWPENGVPKCNLGTRRNVAAGFSLRQHRLESLCHQNKDGGRGVLPPPKIDFSGSQAELGNPIGCQVLLGA